MLTGMHALVTEATEGIGLAIAQALVAENAKILLTGRNEEELHAAADKLHSRGATTDVMVADLTEDADIDKLVDLVAQRYGSLNILVNNAAIIRRSGFLEEKIDTVDEMYRLNVRAPFRLMQGMIPLLLKQEDAWIFNIASLAAKWGIMEMAGYSTTQFAIVGLTEAVAREFAMTQLKAFTICPPAVKTSPLEKLFPETPTRMSPEDVANKIIELCGPKRKHGTGASVTIDTREPDAEETSSVSDASH